MALIQPCGLVLLVHCRLGLAACLSLRMLNRLLAPIVTKTSLRCRITYTSGEEEELKLDEIIREGHMSLITS